MGFLGTILMIILYLMCIVLFFIPAPQCVGNGKRIDTQYLSKDRTLPIKGLSVILVFFRHFNQNVSLNNNVYDHLYWYVNSRSGQLIVTMFLFYSGYGIYESIKKKGSTYTKAFLMHRIIPFWIRFAVCWTLFLVCYLVTGGNTDKWTILLSYTGWTSVGNSNWFVFATLLFYFLILVIFTRFDDIAQRSKPCPLILFTFATIIAACVLYSKKTTFWYDTLFCFPFGMWFSYYKTIIEKTLEKHYGVVFAIVAILSATLYVLQRKVNSLFFCLLSVVFAFLVVMITMKIRFRGSMVNFFGNHVFSMYMLQRIPLYIMKDSCGNNIYVYACASFVATVIMAVAFDWTAERIRQPIMSTIHKTLK